MSTSRIFMPVRFVLLTVALSWSVWVGGWLLAGRPHALGAPGMVPAIYAGSFAPSLAALVLSAMRGRDALRAWAVRACPVRLRLAVLRSCVAAAAARHSRANLAAEL